MSSFRPANAMPKSNAGFSSNDKGHDAYAESGDISGLLKDIVTEGDEVSPKRPVNIHFEQANVKQFSKHHNDIFKESGKLASDSSFDIMMQSRDVSGQSKDRLVSPNGALKLNSKFTSHNKPKEVERKNTSFDFATKEDKPMARIDSIEDALDGFDWK